MMKQILTLLTTIVLITFVCPLYADYSVWDTGNWRRDWPKELEPLRKQSRTLEDPMQPLLHYAIPFYLTIPYRGNQDGVRRAQAPNERKEGDRRIRTSQKNKNRADAS